MFHSTVKIKTMSKLANQAQILRSFQRDADAISHLEAEIKEIFHDLLPNNIGILSRLRYLHYIIARLCYYNYTTLSQNQTLGEEYVGIVLSKPNLTSPTRFNLLCMLTLKVCGPYMVPYAVKLWEKSARNNSGGGQEDLVQTARKFFIIKETLGILQVVKNGIFYLTGSLYDVAMWLTGIKYVFLKPWLNDDKVIHYFRILGVITMIHSIINIINTWYKLQHVCSEVQDDLIGSSDSSVNCYLCLEKRKNTSATPCGHLFCWNCIIDAVRVKPICPLCRENVIPSRVVLLKNYE